MSDVVRGRTDVGVLHACHSMADASRGSCFTKKIKIKNVSFEIDDFADQ